jgi:hypothetical protein
LSLGGDEVLEWYSKNFQVNILRLHLTREQRETRNLQHSLANLRPLQLRVFLNSSASATKILNFDRGFQPFLNTLTKMANETRRNVIKDIEAAFRRRLTDVRSMPEWHAFDWRAAVGSADQDRITDLLAPLARHSSASAIHDAAVRVKMEADEEIYRPESLFATLTRERWAELLRQLVPLKEQKTQARGDCLFEALYVSVCFNEKGQVENYPKKLYVEDIQRPGASVRRLFCQTELTILNARRWMLDFIQSPNKLATAWLIHLILSDVVLQPEAARYFYNTLPRTPASTTIEAVLEALLYKPASEVLRKLQAQKPGHEPTRSRLEALIRDFEATSTVPVERLETTDFRAVFGFFMCKVGLRTSPRLAFEHWPTFDAVQERRISLETIPLTYGGSEVMNWYASRFDVNIRVLGYQSAVYHWSHSTGLGSPRLIFLSYHPGHFDAMVRRF